MASFIAKSSFYWQLELRRHVELRPLGGEIESCLAYTQKSEGQNLPERPI
jgi:hypothetical protein